MSTYFALPLTILSRLFVVWYSIQRATQYNWISSSRLVAGSLDLKLLQLYWASLSTRHRYSDSVYILLKLNKLDTNF